MITILERIAHSGTVAAEFEGGPGGEPASRPAGRTSIPNWIRRVSVRVSLICSINPYNSPYHPFPGSTGGDPPSPGGLGIDAPAGSPTLVL